MWRYDDVHLSNTVLAEQVTEERAWTWCSGNIAMPWCVVNYTCMFPDWFCLRTNRICNCWWKGGTAVLMWGRNRMWCHQKSMRVTHSLEISNRINWNAMCIDVHWFVLMYINKHWQTGQIAYIHRHPMVSVDYCWQGHGTSTHIYPSQYTFHWESPTKCITCSINE